MDGDHIHVERHYSHDDGGEGMGFCAICGADMGEALPDADAIRSGINARESYLSRLRDVDADLDVLERRGFDLYEDERGATQYADLLIAHQVLMSAIRSEARVQA